MRQRFQMVKRRFIAGAICPSCREMDRLFVDADDAGPFFECVSCGYRRVGDFTGPDHGRTTKPDSRREVAPQTVRIVDPNADHS